MLLLLWSLLKDIDYQYQSLKNVCLIFIIYRLLFNNNYLTIIIYYLLYIYGIAKYALVWFHFSFLFLFFGFYCEDLGCRNLKNQLYSVFCIILNRLHFALRFCNIFHRICISIIPYQALGQSHVKILFFYRTVNTSAVTSLLHFLPSSKIQTNTTISQC